MEEQSNERSGEVDSSSQSAQNLSQAAQHVYGGGGGGGAVLLGRSGEGGEEQNWEEQVGVVGSPQSSGSSDYGGFLMQGGGLCDELEKNLDEPSIVLESENGAFQQRMWGCFQNCARAVAQVYMTSRSLQSSSDSTHRIPQPRESPPSRTPSPQPQASKPPQQVEESFKSAAQHATNLYKDSIETSRRLIDLAIKTGSNRRTKEVLAFVKSKKKRFIKRDELISFLAGGGGGKKDGVGGSLSACRKNHVGGGSSGGLFGGVFDVAYPHVLHHVHSGGGGFPNVSLSQQQSHQQHGPLHHIPLQSSPPQPAQLPQQSPNQQHPRLSDPPFPQFSSTAFTPRKHSNDFHPTTTPPQRLLISSSNNASFEDSDPSSMLHLAVQQLFVAGAGLGGGGGNEFVHVAGVKRPAEDGGKKRDDDEDCMMEDSVDGGGDCFKRMRFY